jgi:hypothetical protein
MKTCRLLPLAIVTLSTVVCAEVPPDARAQATALVRYPQLNVPKSPFNVRFLELVAELRDKKSTDLDDPQWPLWVANQVDREFVMAAVEKEAAARAKASTVEIERIKKTVKTIKELETDIPGIIGTKFVVRGTIDVDNYFNWGFRGLEEHLFCFKISDETGTAYGYIRRDVGAPVRARILESKRPLPGLFMLKLPEGVAERGQSRVQALLVDLFPIPESEIRDVQEPVPPR